jgi:bacterioferritin (cytochrome b1)
MGEMLELAQEELLGPGAEAVCNARRLPEVQPILVVVLVVGWTIASIPSLVVLDFVLLAMPGQVAVVGDIDAQQARNAAARVWRFRARAELDAAARFTRLAAELAAGDAVMPVITMAREAAADEMRHAEKCLSLVRFFEGSSFELDALPTSRPVAPKGLASREQLLYEVVAMSCVTETLSAALLGELVAKATDSLVRETMHGILRDEVNHARLGWAHLAAERERGVGDVIGASLPAILAGTVSEELFSSWTEHPAQEMLSGLGSLDRADRKRIFGDTLSQVIFPGLRHFGVNTERGESWLAERMSNRQPQ